MKLLLEIFFTKQELAFSMQKRGVIYYRNTMENAFKRDQKCQKATKMLTQTEMSRTLLYRTWPNDSSKKSKWQECIILCFSMTLHRTWFFTTLLHTVKSSTIFRAKPKAAKKKLAICICTFQTTFWKNSDDKDFVQNFCFHYYWIIVCFWERNLWIFHRQICPTPLTHSNKSHKILWKSIPCVQHFELQFSLMLTLFILLQ